MSPVVERLTLPCVRAMQQMSLVMKFALISAAFLVPLGVAVYGVVSYADANIQFARDEQLGTAYVSPLNDVLGALARERSLADTSARNSRDAMARVEKTTSAQGDALAVKGEIDAVAGTLTHADQALAALVDLYSSVSDNSKLTLDPDLDSYYAMAIVMDYAPRLAEAAGQLDALGRAMRAHGSISADDKASVQFLIARVSMFRKSLAHAVTRMRDTNASLATKLDLTAVERSYAAFMTQAEQLRSGALPEATASAGMSLTAATLEFSGVTAKILDDLLVIRIGGFEHRRNWLLAITLAGILIAAYLLAGFYVANQRGFGALVTRLRKLASGDLSANYSARGHDEIGVLIDAFNVSREQLASLVIKIRAATETLDDAGRQIAEANDDLARREASRAESVRETAESARAVAGNVQRNLDHALNADRLAEGADGVASRGNDVVSQVVTTMQAITGSSRKIGQIIGVIDEIAFQTNLLALNAAVEAARAGEQGRGFAVVAGEVRNLAQRASAAADEIKKLIHASLGDVEKGAVLVETAGGTMREILSSVRGVSQIMKEIAVSSRTQHEDIGRLNQVIDRLDDDTRQNATRVRETASVATALLTQVGGLTDAVSSFTVDGTPVATDTPHEKSLPRSHGGGLDLKVPSLAA